ncbi:tRNA (N6-isopentenyl adenosine(37)-C2)-methylthiotransferase MiaB [Sediminitomix flava]|uniref:tRNA-2-methylthio-N(6)-dimethylallyladenosine synthase n=1 Tax=Sediminitomix flava TaxID=379075 RepID=A0A315ZAB2_SEDFL|nr:tRNA (N6-isopentenyl adenosine(37)-C2)-methylthiotransferase MiaB [Sediminitomix flava]PWJ41020.1 tRNA-i(6)A37 thiotransferase enzyme MiaB [Sediminitomix flava]
MSDLIKDLDILPKKEEKDISCEARISQDNAKDGQRKLYIESYGCQMNFSDSEIVASVMEENNFGTTSNVEEADLIFLNTCSIRDKAEQTVRKRLQHYNNVKKNKPGLLIGVLGCMAERLKTKLLEEEKIVDIVAGPDAYRDLPKLVAEVDEGGKGVNVFLSREETYADISPVRLNSNGITAFISIMRGCDNMCSFCVVPFTRGRERSRDPKSVVAEAQELFDQGYREVTLLGQNVDSYKWSDDENNKARLEKKEKAEDMEITNFANLLEMVAKVSPELRVRFSTSHPKDITDEVLHTMAKYENICNYIHLPVQSGNSRVLDIMNRTYDREWYLNRVEAIRRILGEECGISSDMITGFCTETEEEHQDTLSLMDIVKYDLSYMFYYSERPGTLAEKKFEDDIPLDVKKRRLAEIIEKQGVHSLERYKMCVGNTYKVLIEGYSKRSKEHLQGRTSSNKVVVFPKKDFKLGEYAEVKIHDCTAATLIGESI